MWPDLDNPNDNLDELIAGYIADHTSIAAQLESGQPNSGPGPDFDGRLSDWLLTMIRSQSRPPDGPERAWPVILELIAGAPDDAVLDYIGVGPLEDLVNRHGLTFIDRFRDQAAGDPHFVRALSSVWTSRHLPPDVEQVIDEARQAFPEERFLEPEAMAGHNHANVIEHARRRRPEVDPNDENRQAFRVVLEREGDFWLISVPDLNGILTQARNRAEIETMARDRIAIELDVPRYSFDIQIVGPGDPSPDRP